MRILRAVGCNARQASTLRIFERLVPDDGAPHESKMFDLGMLLLTGGRERTLDEFERLLNHTGWDLERISPAYGTAHVIQARRAS